MFIKKIELENYKVLDDISINFEPKNKHNIFPIISVNGGGKSTLLQFVFAFLHCSFKEERYKYLETMLEYYKNVNPKDKLNKIVRFQLEYANEPVNLEFIHCKSNYKNLNFNSIITIRELNERKRQINQSIEDIKILDKLANDIENSSISTPLLRRELNKFVNSSEEREMLRYDDKSNYLMFINNTKQRLEDSLISDEELSTMLIKAETEKNRLSEELNKLDLST